MNKLYDNTYFAYLWPFFSRKFVLHNSLFNVISDLPLEEQDLARLYPAHTALCIRDGWDFCDVHEAFGK